MRGISKSYGSRKVLDQIDLDIYAGEKIALIGPSGSGKTTILRMLIGLDKPDDGTIQIGDQYLWHEVTNNQLRPAGERHARNVRRSLGMVYQQFNLFPHMTALANVQEPLMHVRRVDRTKSAVIAKELLARVGLESHVDKRPNQLSGGQQQRVAIARSLALQPEIMLFDEVTSALDPELVGEVLIVLRELAAASNMSMLLVTHEIDFAAEIADRVLMFDAGKIIESGCPKDVLKKPTHDRTKQFLKAILDR